MKARYSNTTLVKVKSKALKGITNLYLNSNTTLVKVKFYDNLLTLSKKRFKYNTC